MISRILLSPLALVMLVGISACGGNAETAAVRIDKPARVIVEPLQFERVRTRLEAVGTSRALQSVELYPVRAGDVVAVNFEPGEYVGRGQTLVELDSREERLAVELAEVRLADAERLFDRYQRSSSSGAVLPTVIDQAETAVQTARIELEQAQVALDYRTIQAPFAGFVGVTEVDPGDRIGPDTLVTTLDNRSAILVSFNVPEAFVGKLVPGDVVDLQSWSARDPNATGNIVDISSRIDPQNRTFVARARVDNQNDEFRPGMSFRVIADLEGPLYPVVAETGVQWGADGAYVWSIRDDRAVRMPVQIIQRREGRVLVDADLDSGAIVVVEGIQGIRDGVEVSFETRSYADEGLETVTMMGTDRATGSD